jgi:hypothetical protein
MPCDLYREHAFFGLVKKYDGLCRYHAKKEKKKINDRAMSAGYSRKTNALITD